MPWLHKSKCRNRRCNATAPYATRVYDNACVPNTLTSCTSINKPKQNAATSPTRRGSCTHQNARTSTRISGAPSHTRQGSNDSSHATTMEPQTKNAFAGRDKCSGGTLRGVPKRRGGCCWADELFRSTGFGLLKFGLGAGDVDLQ